MHGKFSSGADEDLHCLMVSAQLSWPLRLHWSELDGCGHLPEVWTLADAFSRTLVRQLFPSLRAELLTESELVQGIPESSGFAMGGWSLPR